MAKEQVISFIDTIGPDNLVKIGFTERSIRKARTDGFFAARWYDPFKRLADAFGAECPRSMFAWVACDVDCVLLAIQSGISDGIVQEAETK